MVSPEKEFGKNIENPITKSRGCLVILKFSKSVSQRLRFTPLPYCRRCGVLLKENASFCHKCGIQMVTFATPPPPNPVHKSSASTAIIVLVAVVAATVIFSLFVFAIFFATNPHSLTSENQTNVSKLSFNLGDGAAQANVLAKGLAGKTSLITVPAQTWHKQPVPLPS